MTTAYENSVNERLDYLRRAKRARTVGMTVQQYEEPYYQWWNARFGKIYSAKPMGPQDSVKVEFENGTAVMSQGKTVGQLRELADKRGGFKKSRSDLEALWEDVGKPVMKAVKAVAPFIAIIPGIGTGVAIALSAASSVALGDRITDAALNAATAAVPGGVTAQAAFKAAGSTGLALARGEKIDTAALASVRDALPSDQAKQAYDMGIALSKAKGLQDQGYQNVAAIIDVPEDAKVTAFRALQAQARALGISTEALLHREVKVAYAKMGASHKAAVFDLKSALETRDDKVTLTIDEVATAANCPRDVARAALSWAVTGTPPDGDIIERFGKRGIKPAGKQDPCVRYPIALAQGSVAAPGLLRLCQEKKARERAEVVRVIAEQQTRNTVAKSVLGLGALSLAGVALYKFWWMRR